MSDPIERLTSALADRYRIERELGAGGMATVYLADDLKHNRKVAIKVLKPELAAVVGAERFLAEIETTANLQHPHILPLFDSGEADGFLFYVMPYVEGETLRDRIDRERQLPVDEAVGIAIAVANALQTAHEQGIIHRDIKPANILLSRGEPLVADFGIALAVGAAGGNRLTETGLSVGTPYYMSPEQATGDQPVGAPSDTYALACVLFEMLTGDPPYQGSTAQAVLGKIIQGSPPSATEARSSVPPNVDGAILKALEKLPADRFGSAKGFAAALSSLAFRYGDAAAGASGSGRAWTGLTSAFAVATLVLAALTAWALTRSPVKADFNQFTLGMEEAVTGDVDLGDRGRLGLSPDGRRLVFVGPGAGAGEGTRLWLRDFARLGAEPIADTDGGYNPTFSPDGDHVAFVTFRDGVRQIRRISLAGGSSLLVADSLIDGGGLSWGLDGYIYTDAGLADDGFARVPEEGGPPEIVTRPGEGESWHASPFALPNGKGVLFYAEGPDQIAVVDLETGEHAPLVEGLWGGYAESGHLLWITDTGTLMAQPFDQDSFELSGRAVRLVEGLLIPVNFGGGNVAISRTGDLVYITGESRTPELSLVWVDRTGNESELDPDWRRPFVRVALSPNGGEVAVTIEEAAERHIWVKSTEGGPPRRLTFEGYNRGPAWLPGGEWVGYVSLDRETPGIYKRRSDGSGGEVLVLAHESRDPVRLQWSSDGEWLVYDDSRRVIAQRLGDDGLPQGDPMVLLDPDDDGAAGQDVLARISPDGRWLASTQVRASQGRVHVRPFPNVEDGNWLLTEGSSAASIWSRDGDELAFLDLDSGTVSVVPVTAGEAFRSGPAEALFSRAPYRFPVMEMDPGGERFLLLRPGSGGESEQNLVLVQNFFQVLRERVGG